MSGYNGTGYPNTLTNGLSSLGTYLPFDLWAGESDIVTSQGVCGTTALEQFRVIAQAADGTLIPWVTGATDSTGFAIGFTAQAAVVGGPVAYFSGGVPNHAALVWPVAVTTLAARRAAFNGSNIQVSYIL